MHRSTLPAHRMTPADAQQIVAGFLSDRRAKHGDATMTAPPGGEGGDGGGDGGAGGGGGSDAGGGRTAPTDPADPNYFPPNTAVTEMTADQRAAYWRFEAKRANDRVPANLSELQQKAREYDDLVAATRSDGEVAIDEALEIGREEGRAEVLQEAAAELLRTHLSTGRTDDQVAVLMRGINPAGFITDEGKLDGPGIAAFAATLGGGTGGGGRDIGQGRRGGQAKASVASGRDLYQDRRSKKEPATT